MALPEFLAWCTAGGVAWAGIEAGFVAEGWRGVIATQELMPGTCILRVPFRLLMCTDSARRDPQLSAALQKSDGTALRPEQVLAVHLLYEASKGAASFWHPYIRSLPRAYTTAMCFTDAEVAELQVPTTVAAARRAAAVAATAHAAALPVLRALRLAPNWRSSSAWLWAASTLSSRTMFLPACPAGALTPFGDFHNYRPPPPPYTPTLADLLAGAAAASANPAFVAERAAPAPAAPAAEAAAVQTPLAGAATAGQEVEGCDSIAGDGHLDQATGEYRIFARQRYRAGEQVFLCYGRHTNLELLVHYGFVLPDNPHDTAVLPLRLLPAAVQQQLAGSGGGTWEDRAAGIAGEELGDGAAAAAYLHANGAPCWALLRALRLGSATSAERKSAAYLALSDRPISAACERAAFETLQAACEAALAALPTLLEQDQQQLAVWAAQEHQQAEQRQQPEQHQQQEQRRDPRSAAAGGARSVPSNCLRVAVEWRAGHKRILQHGIALCAAVLAALPPSPAGKQGSLGPAAACQTGPAAAGDIAARLAALQRKPRW